MFHVRFTPYDISGYTFSFLDKFERYIIGREHVDSSGNPLLHYHILVDTTYGEKTLRDSSKLSLKIPVGGRGKNNAYYALIKDWKDPSYMCKYGDIISYKGYTEAEVLVFIKLGKETYLDKKKVVEIQVIPEEMRPKPKVSKVPYQQMVINTAYVDWMVYKRDCKEKDEIPSKSQIVEIVCNAMRKEGKGINPYMVKELAYAVLYDDLEYRSYILRKVRLVF